MVKVRGRNSNGKTVKQTVKNGRKISGDDAARPAWVMVPGVSSSRLRPNSDQSRIWCRARPWLGCDSLNELTWVGFVVHDNLFFFFFFFFFEGGEREVREVGKGKKNSEKKWGRLSGECEARRWREKSKDRRKTGGKKKEKEEEEKTRGGQTRKNTFFGRFVSVVWQDSDRVWRKVHGTAEEVRCYPQTPGWYDIGERSHPNPMHRSSLFQRDFQNR